MHWTRTARGAAAATAVAGLLLCAAAERVRADEPDEAAAQPVHELEGPERPGHASDAPLVETLFFPQLHLSSAALESGGFSRSTLMQLRSHMGASRTLRLTVHLPKKTRGEALGDFSATGPAGDVRTLRVLTLDLRY